jgi:hypothetical protein
MTAQPKRERHDTVEEPSVRRRKERKGERAPDDRKRANEGHDQVDEASDASFPASDPPSFNPGAASSC